MKINRLSAIAFLVAVVFAPGCGKETVVEPESVMEISLDAVSQTRTKGYVENASLVDTPKEFLHGGEGFSYRPIYLTAWHHPQHGTEVEYFRTKTFVRNGGSATDGMWHHDSPLYWPVEGTLDLLAFSCTNAFPTSSLAYSPGNTTERLSFNVDHSYSQDDILFSFVGNAGKDTGCWPSVPMVFQHAQAWIEFSFHTVDASYDDIITIHRVDFRDIYTSGVLTMDHPFGFAEGSWDYRYATRQDTPVDDEYGVYGTGVTTTKRYLDMLLPEQEKKDIVIYYTMKDCEPLMQYVYHLGGSHWEMGKKYVYDIRFSPTRIEVEQSVNDWTTETYNKYLYRKDIPEEYRRLQYVAFDGTTVDTGYKTGDGSVIEASFEVVDSPSQTVGYLYRSDADVHGSGLTTWTQACVGTDDAAGRWRFGARTASVGNAVLTRDAVHALRHSASGVWIDGVQAAEYDDVSAFTSTRNLAVGFIKDPSHPEGSVRYYSFSHERDGVLLTDMVPVARISDNLAGFWDYATRKFYAGGIAGPSM